MFDEKGATRKAKYVSIREIVPSDRSYYSSTIESDGVTAKVELIEIGEKSYIKKDGGKWEEYNSEPAKNMAGIGFTSSVKVIEETIFNGQPVKVYMEEGVTSSGEGDFNTTTKYWFTSEGELLKTEAERKN